MKYRDLNPQMSWPPKEDDLKLIRNVNYIPRLLVFSGKSLESGSCTTKRTIREKQRYAQDIAVCLFFFSVKNGTVVETPKSLLFPSIVKALCKNTEIGQLINKYAQGASYDLVEEIEMEYASEVINKH